MLTPMLPNALFLFPVTVVSIFPFFLMKPISVCVSGEPRIDGWYCTIKNDGMGFGSRGVN